LCILLLVTLWSLLLLLRRRLLQLRPDQRWLLLPF
jgi:hypothetical protein